MSFLMLFFKLRSSLILFCSSYKVWQFPSKCDVLIYDASGIEVLLPYLNKCCVNIFPTRGESFNIPCLLLAALTPAFWSGKIFTAYSRVFIQASSPVLIVTFIDNNCAFYEISNHFPHTKTLFLQNGFRVFSGDVFDSISFNKKYHVDYMLVFGPAIGNLYSKYISGLVLPVGSLKNNYFQKSCSVNKNRVLFISQFRRKPDNNVFYTDSNGPVYWSDFYKAEREVIPFLENWCYQNSKTLQVCGVELDGDKVEEDFYKSLFIMNSSEYIPSAGIHSSYQLVDSAEIVVFIDSTLGYESLARGKKTASFCCRLYGLLPLFNAFGWPADLPNSGPFWTNDLDVAEFNRIMDFLDSVNDEEWVDIVLAHTTDLIIFNPGNTLLVDLLETII